MSALVRSNHQLQSRFDPPPTFGILEFSLFFEGASLLGCLGDSLGAMRFKQLPGVILNIQFFHRFIPRRDPRLRDMDSPNPPELARFHMPSVNAAAFKTLCKYRPVFRGARQ